MIDLKNWTKNILSSSIKFSFKSLGIGVTSYKNLVHLKEFKTDRSFEDLEFIFSMGSQHYESMLTLLRKSKSQLRQDLFVIAESEYKQKGYFVEFGATNGIDLSNSFLLATEFSWSGILAEPATIWEKNLVKNRPESHIETSCVWKDSDSTLEFNETTVAELSTIDFLSDKDYHKLARTLGKKYEVRTISLMDMLKKYDSPKYIDYLSVDTEGSEYEILSAFDFDEYSFGVITVEHNYTQLREKIFTLLTSKGYKRKFEEISYFDDWYTK